MVDILFLLPYASIAFIVASTVLGVGLGTGIASTAGIQAINIQPKAKNEINRATIIGLALIETAAILALIITFMTFNTMQQNIDNVLLNGIAYIGISCAIGISGFVVGIASALPVKKACLSIARQPFFSQKILNIMLITQSIIQTASIFGFLIGMFIMLQLSSVETLTHSLVLCAAGISIGVGCIGPVIGLGRFAQTACECVSINKKSYGKIIPFVFMSEAIIETPLIFAFLVALILVGTGASKAASDSLFVVRALAAAMCIGIGTLAPSLSSSKTASAACYQIAYNPDNYPTLSQTSMFGQGLIDAAAVYALLVSLSLLFL